MKRFVTLVIALSTLSGVFAQQSVDLDLKESKTVPISLDGPSQTIPVDLLLNVTYQPEEEILKVVMKGDKSQEDPRNSSTNKKIKDQITHLLFLLNWNGFNYHEINLKSYFKDPYQSKAKLEKPIKEQTVNTSGSGIFRPAFEIDNGVLENKSVKDIIFSLSDSVVFKIKVLNLELPVQLKINNVIPFRAAIEGTLFSNKFFLKYISNSYTITFNLPEDPCARQYDSIRQYEKLNRRMRSDLERLNDYACYNHNNKNGILQRQWSLIYKYNDVRKQIVTTECVALKQQFDIFNEIYGKILKVNDFTPDSLERVIKKLYSLRDSLLNENNGTSCEKLKDQTKKYVATVESYKEAIESIESIDEVQDLVGQFKELRDSIDNVNCAVEEVVEEPISEDEKPISLPQTLKNTSRCDCGRFREAADKINTMDNKYALGVNNKKAFELLVREMDKELESLSTSCKKSCEKEISQYKSAKKMYQKNTK